MKHLLSYLFAQKFIKKKAWTNISVMKRTFYLEQISDSSQLFMKENTLEVLYKKIISMRLIECLSD